MNHAEPLTGSTDEVLMTAVRNGETAHLAELFERYHRPLYRFAARVSGDNGIAEDVVQDTFLRVLKHRHTYRPDRTFRPWLYRIARNVWHDALAVRKRDRELPDALAPPSQETPIESIERRETRRQLRRAVAALPLASREVLLLARFEDLPYREIAEVLDISVANVKVRVHRALTQLRDQMTRTQMPK